MKTFKSILIKIVQSYKYLISPLFGNSCRYLPSCSDYAIEALKTFGIFKSLFLSFKRILSCHPWGNGGFDPVKKRGEIKK